MGLDQVFGAMGISASGMSAERLRMEVVANNIANAQSTRSAEGGPYRRKDVLFQSVLSDQLGQEGDGEGSLGGVEVVGIQDDPSELMRVFNPGHPDADAEGYLLMPNVKLPMEMVNLITASRAYEANLRVMRSFRQMAEQAISLLRG